MRLPLALAQLRPVKADPEASLDRIAGVLERVAGLEAPPRVLLLPETALTGYFLEGGVREHALPADAVFGALRDRWSRVAGDRPLEVAVGFYERRRDRAYNAAMYAELGGEDPGIRHVHRKVFLPTYGVFQEDRFVEAGAGFRAFDTSWGRAALLVCEDAWHSLSSTLAALDGARAIFVLSASPAHGAAPGPGVPGNVERWDRLARAIAEEHGVWVALCQLTGFEGGKGFPGGSVVVDPRGRPVARAALWEEELLTAELDLDALLPARASSPLLADLEAALPRILASSPAARSALAVGSGRGEERDGGGPEASDDGGANGGAGAPAAGGASGGHQAKGGGDADRERDADPERASGRTDGAPGAVPALGAALPGPLDPRPDPDDPSPLDIDPGLVEGWLVQFLRQEMKVRRGFERAVVGMSGGVDSSLTTMLCARALGGENVTGFLLPTELTSGTSRDHAMEVAERAGVRTRTIPVAGPVRAYVEEHEPDADPLRRGNVMARQRMIVLFDQARKLGALPVGTGNKSERLLGYFTWHADDAPPINPLGDLFKTQVWTLARHVGVPDAIVEKPATAELVEDQTDEGELGLGYPEADLILHHFLQGRRPRELVEAGFEERKVELVRERLASSHFKRHLPTVAMLSDTAINEWYLRPVDY